ncbi:MobF family relaxase [Nocardia sp. NPDC006630]|uniref:MobF family relaxase n=1 Tax=Nocardia sp. NPDC006630 TaxID=3157181 RepID=UPI00339FAF2C
MTIHPIHAGDGYTYLTRQVATGDRTRANDQNLTDYYTASGAPAGQWWGRGAQLLGVSGEVTEAQMQALYGEGIHPNADEMMLQALHDGKSVREALAATQLGSGHHRRGQGTTDIAAAYAQGKAEFLLTQGRSPTKDEWATLRENAARTCLAEDLGQEPSDHDITDALADEKRRLAHAVAAYDCVFTPQKSISILWGLADDDTRRAIWECHEQAIKDTLDRVEDNYALARRGAGGARQIDAHGLTFAMYQHFDNRTGDPNPHTHVVVSARVRGSDEKWCALDARALFSATVSLSCQYNATLTGMLQRRLGLRFEERYRGGISKAPVLEIADVPEEMITAFSRRPDILRATEELVREYRAKHGRTPSKATQIKLTQAATLATRDAKPIPKTLREMLAEWADRVETLLGDGRTAQEFVRDVVYLSNNPDAVRRYTAQHAALAAGIALGGAQEIAQAPRSRIRARIAEALQMYEFRSDSARTAAAAEVFELLDPGNDRNLLDRLELAASAAERTVYDPERLAADVLDTVSRRRSTWTEVHVRAAAEDRISLCHFDSDHAQREAVEQLVDAVRGQCLQLSIDPDPVPAALARRNGENVYSTRAATTIRYTSQAVLDAETALCEAARTPTTEFVTTTAVDTAIAATEADTGQQLNAGQRDIVRHLCTSGTRLAVAIGPAGTGKTTAMRAVARTWIDDGRTVIALAPQKSAARILGEEIEVPARTIDALLTIIREGGDAGLGAGTMLLVDEAGMANTHNLHKLQTIADHTGAVVRWIGDPAQLSAVEAGGVLRLISRDTLAPHLQEVVRFTDPDEADASLFVRGGDAEQAWEFYKNAGRVVSGMADELREQILTAHLDDLDRGVSSLMMAATLDDVQLLNGTAQTAYALRGHVDTNSAGARLADAHTAHAGDLIVTRRNTNKLRITGGYRRGDPVDNGEQWRVHAVHDDGSLTVTGITHHGHVHLPTRYVRDSVELGYASTVHRAQGMTVQRAYVLMGSALGRSLAYVGLTRGSEYNGIFLATDTLPEPDLDHAPGEELTEYEVWCRELERGDDNISATERLREEIAAGADDPQRTREIYDYARTLLSHPRLEDLLERALPVDLAQQVQASPHYPTLLETLDLAEQASVDTTTLVGLIATDRWRATDETLDETGDPAAVLRARADRHIARLLGLPARGSECKFSAVRDLQVPELPALPPRHPGMDSELADYAAALYERLSSAELVEELDANPDRVAAISHLADALALDTDSAAELPVRIDRMRADYEHCAKVLGRDWARYQLAEQLPSGLHRLVVDGRDYEHLLDVLADARAAGTDTSALLTEITTATEPRLVRGSDIATVFTQRAAAILERHHLETGEPVTAPTPTPLPPEHPDTDRAVSDHATDLLHQIGALQQLHMHQQMLAEPFRTLTSAVLDTRIRQLRNSVTSLDPAELSNTGRESLEARIQAQHEQVDVHSERIRAAQQASAAAQRAAHALADAELAVREAQHVLDELPTYRRTARRDSAAALEAAHATRNDLQARARTTAAAAARARTETGVPEAQWAAMLARDTDTVRAAELAAARATDARTQAARERRDAQRTTAAGRLEQAQAERARRRGLSPAERAAEQRWRAAHPNPEHDIEPENSAAPPEQELGHGPDHGAHL